MQRRLLFVVDGIDVCTSSQQHLDGLLLVAVCRKVQRAAAGLVPAVYCCAAAEEGLQDGQVALAGCFLYTPAAAAAATLPTR